MRTSLITLFLFYILSQMNAQYVIEEWNVSALNQDSLLKRKIMYDSLNRPIQCIMFGKEDVTINYVYSDSSSKLVYENWNTVEKGNYLTYETKYDSFNRPYEIFETLDGIRSLTKKYIYKNP